MACDFNGVNQYLTVGTSPVTAAPLTIAAWFRKASTDTVNGIYLRDALDVNDYFGLYFTTQVGGNVGQGGIDAAFQASGNYSVNTWGHACLVEESSTSRIIYRDGGNSTTNSTFLVPANISELRIGTFAVSANFDGQLAEIGIWNAALTPAEVASLADGMTCDKVRPQNLAFYAPLIREIQDVRGARTITNNNGATIATHPRVYA
jgi:hypothetical protein